MRTIAFGKIASEPFSQLVAASLANCVGLSKMIQWRLGNVILAPRDEYSTRYIFRGRIRINCIAFGIAS